MPTSPPESQLSCKMLNELLEGILEKEKEGDDKTAKDKKPWKG